MRDNSHLAWMNIEGGNYAVGAGLPVAMCVSFVIVLMF